MREWNDQIVFLRKIVPGAADKSYGIQVARLAGLPKPVIERAKIHPLAPRTALDEARGEKAGPEGEEHRQPMMPEPNPPQMDLFAEF